MIIVLPLAIVNLIIGRLMTVNKGSVGQQLTILEANPAPSLENILKNGLFIGIVRLPLVATRLVSGGQQQRVAIARTLALNPDVILFDEPMSALDAANRLTLRDEIKRIQREFGSTMIYITHDQEEAFSLSDRIMVMHGGTIRQLATPQEIIRHPADDYVEEFVIRNLNKKIDSLMKYVER